MALTRVFSRSIRAIRPNLLNPSLLTSTARLGQVFVSPLLTGIQQRNLSDSSFDPLSAIMGGAAVYYLMESDKKTCPPAYVDHHIYSTEPTLSNNKSTTFQKVEEIKSEPQLSNNNAGSGDYRIGNSMGRGWIPGDIHK